MADYISREAAIAYIREQSEECQKAFEELGGESGIYADAYNDLAEDFYSIPAADVAPVVRCKDCKWFADNNGGEWYGCKMFQVVRITPEDAPKPDDFCSYGELQMNGGGGSDVSG